MRPSSVISVLAVVAYSLPIAPFNDSLLDGLQDFIYKSVNGLLYPFGLYDRPGCQLLSSNFDPKYCVAQCVPNCTGGAQKCSDCLISCYRENSCYGGNPTSNQPDNQANPPTPTPAAPNDPPASPAPDAPAPAPQ